ncbi:hypothetical protein H0H87_005364, partial [Tephrocybe sp. NHM501043]
MGPTGFRSLLLELHTLRFNILQSQYLETAFEVVHGHHAEPSTTQTTLHDHFSERIPSFGDFGDQQGYAGSVPGERYLTKMLNKAVERDEHDANQHTACLAPDQISIDDSHKVNKHLAKIDGMSLFSALWTLMDSRYIRAQVLTLTKAHDERAGPLHAVADSIKKYGFLEPPIAFSDDPTKDKSLLYDAFPSLSQNLTPTAAAHGLKPLELPSTLQIVTLGSIELAEQALAPLMAPLDLDPSSYLCLSIDAEWNMSRRIGVSILQLAPHSMPDFIYIVPVHRYQRLPTSLLRLLVSKQVFKIGSNVKGDLTRLQKQFVQLSDQPGFNVVELKEYCIQRGIITRKESGTLDKLLEKATQMYLLKNAQLRRNDGWEDCHISSELLRYAALDVFASRTIFEAAAAMLLAKHITHETPHGTQVSILVQEGGAIAAYGRISAFQPKSLAGIQVATQGKMRLVIDVDAVISPSAAAILHLIPPPTSGAAISSGKTKAGTYTYGQLRASTSSSCGTFQVVVPISLLEFDHRNPEPSTNVVPDSDLSSLLPISQVQVSHEPVGIPECLDDDEFDNIESLGPEVVDLEAEVTELQMLEAQAIVEQAQT